MWIMSLIRNKILKYIIHKLLSTKVFCLVYILIMIFKNPGLLKITTRNRNILISVIFLFYQSSSILSIFDILYLICSVIWTLLSNHYKRSI